MFDKLDGTKRMPIVYLLKVGKFSFEIRFAIVNERLLPSEKCQQLSVTFQNSLLSFVNYGITLLYFTTFYLDN